jgi:hypothetical protein
MTLLQTAHAALATWKIPCTTSYNAQAWLTFGTSLGLWMMQPATWNMELLPTLP